MKFNEMTLEDFIKFLKKRQSIPEEELREQLVEIGYPFAKDVEMESFDNVRFYSFYWRDGRGHSA